MSDLISRKAVLKYLSELCETKDTSAYGLQLMGNHNAMKSKLAERDCVKGIIENIRGFDCAYDVDKVVERLEELKDCGQVQYKECEKYGVGQCHDCIVDRVKALLKGVANDE